MTKLVVGTRGSALALWQAEHVSGRLRAADAALSVELRVIKTKGDKILDVPLAKVGGKGLFVKEIEQALQRREVDLAVHSMKDLPSELAQGLTLAAVTEREDPRDALVSRAGGGLENLAPGATVGTSSLRRRCQLLQLRPDLEVAELRGNVDTRLRKLEEGRYDAVLLAAAGLRRLGHAERITELLEPGRMIPAVGQGALGIEARADDAALLERLTLLHHARTAAAVTAERSFLGRLGGGCQVPVAAHGRLAGGTLTLEALIGHPSGAPTYRGEVAGPADEARRLGEELAEELLRRGGRAVLDEIY